MKITYCEDVKMSHYEIKLIAHPKNMKLAKLLVSQFTESLGEIEVYDEYRNKYPIPLLGVYYFEVIDHKIFVYTETEVFRLRCMPMAKLRELFQPAGFYQINVRTLVNTRHVLKYKKQRGSRRKLVLDNGDMLISSRHYKDGFEKLIDDKAFIGFEELSHLPKQIKKD